MNGLRSSVCWGELGSVPGCAAAGGVVLESEVCDVGDSSRANASANVVGALDVLADPVSGALATAVAVSGIRVFLRRYRAALPRKREHKEKAPRRCGVAAVNEAPESSCSLSLTAARAGGVRLAGLDQGSKPRYVRAITDAPSAGFFPESPHHMTC